MRPTTFDLLLQLWQEWSRSIRLSEVCGKRDEGRFSYDDGPSRKSNVFRDAELQCAVRVAAHDAATNTTTDTGAITASNKQDLAADWCTAGVADPETTTSAQLDERSRRSAAATGHSAPCRATEPNDAPRGQSIPGAYSAINTTLTPAPRYHQLTRPVQPDSPDAMQASSNPAAVCRNRSGIRVAPQIFELTRLLGKRRKTPVEYWRSIKLSRQLVLRRTYQK